MGYPSFSQTGMSTLVFSRGNVFPSPYEEVFGQLVVSSEAGTVRVATIRPPIIYQTLDFQRLPLSDFIALKAWLHDPLVRGSAYPFTYTDSQGVATVVRWWPWGSRGSGVQNGGVFVMPQTSYLRYQVDLVLRVEAVAW